MADPRAAAKAAHLRYVTDRRPGIERRRAGRAFSYRAVDGSVIREPDELRRIRALAIPPAWTDVWISPSAQGHIQATGRDARGRKQYRYHRRWRETRDDSKYGRTLAFGDALPAIRARVDQDLARRGLPREKVLAAVVKLLETTLIRVGNAEYAKDNESFGLTTLRPKHLKTDGGHLRFEFIGKHGKKHTVPITDRRLRRIVKRCQELRGQELLQYQDEEGVVRDVDSGDINDYLQEITGDSFTAKDFRTWAGTVRAARALSAARDAGAEAAPEHQLKRDVVRAIEEVSRSLGNTPAVCRRCYVHPAIVDAYLEGTTIDPAPQRTNARIADRVAQLDGQEGAVLKLLRDRLPG